jgi:hypothetical protein
MSTTLNVSETRAEHLDPALSAAGLGQADGSRVLRAHQITAGRLQGAGKRAQAFFSLVLDQYVTQGVDTLAPEKLKLLSKMCFSEINDAMAFLGMQRYLYKE